MKRLYLRIYLAVLAALTILALAAALLWSQMDNHAPQDELRNSVAALAANALPPASATRETQQAALERLFAGVHAGATLYSAQRDLIASVNGAQLPLPPPPAGSGHGGWMHAAGGPLLWVVALDDGRLLVVAPHLKPGAQRYGVLAMLALLAAAIGVGAYPVVRRLTRRLERLQAGVEALGAGTLSARVEVRGHDEVARLAASFNRAAARIEQLVQAHKSLLANASHELRTPLTRLRLGIEFLAADAEPARAQALARDIAELDELIEEILLASRLDATGDVTQTPTAVDLLALVAEECAHYEAAAFDGEPATVQGEARLLRRLTRNLLENARRHGAPPIEVTLHACVGWAELTVRDHGRGVASAERELVFEPFYRRSGSAQGYGLGLALVRQIARHQGGDAVVEGSAFRVRLPLGGT